MAQPRASGSLPTGLPPQPQQQGGEPWRRTWPRMRADSVKSSSPPSDVSDVSVTKPPLGPRRASGDLSSTPTYQSTSSLTSEKEVRLLMLGSPSVGKSEMLCSCHMTMDCKRFKVYILDMPGEPLQPPSDTAPVSISDNVDWADGVVVAFSLTDRDSFHDALRSLDLLRKRPPHDFMPAILCGTKSDLTHLRVLSETEIHDSISRRNCAYVETSSSDDNNSVVDAFGALFHEIRICRHRLGRRGRRRSGCSRLKDTLRHIAEEFRNRTHSF